MCLELIWEERNRKLFNYETLSANALYQRIYQTLESWTSVKKNQNKAFKQLYCNWSKFISLGYLNSLKFMDRRHIRHMSSMLSWVQTFAIPVQSWSSHSIFNVIFFLESTVPFPLLFCWLTQVNQIYFGSFCNFPIYINKFG